MVFSPAGLRPELDCAGEAQQQQQITDSLVREGSTKLQTHNCLKKISRRKTKLIAGPRWVPDTKKDWLTDCRS
jgi:hypothetical protein